MDVNEVPSDVVVDKQKIEEKKMVNYDGVVDKELEYVIIKSNEVEQSCREIEENRLVLELEIRKKEMNLKVIEAKIRVLGDEKKTVEDEIRDLKNKEEVALEGAQASDINGGKFSLKDCEIKSDELSRVDQLMVENKVLEYEKNMAIKEVEVWKQKCKDLDLCVLQLERRLQGKGKDSIPIGIKAEAATAMNCDDDCVLREFGSPSCMHGAMDGVLPKEDNQCVATEHIPTNKVQVNRRLAYPNERNCDVKIAPATPAGKSSAASVIDITDSDNECDVHARHKPNSQSEGYTYMISETGVHKTDKIMDCVHLEEEQTSGWGDLPSILSPMTKRKRDLMVITSDDECENNECTPNRRLLKIENSDSEVEKDVNNIKPIRRVSKRTISENDDEDGIPMIFKRSHAHKCSSRTATTSNSARPRRRLVKYEQAEPINKDQEVKHDPDTLTAENAANDELSEEESGSSVRSLSSFIVDDSDDEKVDYDALKDDGQDGQDQYSELEEGSDDNLDFEEIISRLQSRRHTNSKWTSEGDMLADFGKNPELCLRAVCAVYRQQTNEEKACKASLEHNGRGFSKFDATRGTFLGDFLTDGDSNGDLVKSVEELQEYHPHGLEECRTLADRYSKQLFKIYENKEDRFFP